MVALYSFVYLPPVVLFPYALTVWIQVDELKRLSNAPSIATSHCQLFRDQQQSIACSLQLSPYRESSVLSRVDEAVSPCDHVRSWQQALKQHHSLLSSSSISLAASISMTEKTRCNGQLHRPDSKPVDKRSEPPNKYSLLCK